MILYFRWKEIVAEGKACKEKLFLIKSGEVAVWFKMIRSHIKKHQRKLEEYKITGEPLLNDCKFLYDSKLFYTFESAFKSGLSAFFDL